MVGSVGVLAFTLRYGGGDPACVGRLGIMLAVGSAAAAPVLVAQIAAGSRLVVFLSRLC